MRCHFLIPIPTVRNCVSNLTLKQFWNLFLIAQTSCQKHDDIMPRREAPKHHGGASRDQEAIMVLNCYWCRRQPQNRWSRPQWCLFPFFKSIYACLTSMLNIELHRQFLESCIVSNRLNIRPEIVFNFDNVSPLMFELNFAVHYSSLFLVTF